MIRTTVQYDPDEVLTLAEFSEFLVDVPVSENNEVTQAIIAAIEKMEEDTGRAYALRTYELFLDKWPTRISLPMPPLNSVTSVEYINESDVLTPIDAADYKVYGLKVHGRNGMDCYGGYIEPVDDWPSDEKEDTKEIIKVTFIAGYDEPPGSPVGVFLIPEIAKMGARHLTSHFYSAKRGEDSSASLKSYETTIFDLITYSFV